MNLIVCLDDNNGMMFHHRRLSQDKEIRKDIYKYCHKLIMNEYSYQMFSKDDPIIEIIISEDIIETDIDQFIEDKSLKEYEKKINRLIIYYWNRKYPSDLQFDIDLTTHQWKLVSQEDIIGKSHENITKKIYKNDI